MPSKKRHAAPAAPVTAATRRLHKQPEEPSLVLTHVKAFQANETEAILEYYKKYQVVHVKNCIDPEKFSFSSVQSLYHSEPAMVNKTFTVETKHGESGHCQYTAADIYGTDCSPSGEWYTSFLAQGGGVSSRSAVSTSEDSLRQSLSRFQTSLPTLGLPLTAATRGSTYTTLLGKGSEGNGITHTNPIWIFVGKNCSDSGSSLHGRPEHVDSVEHDGTWHAQCRGSKVWFIRPAESAEWGKVPVTVSPTVKGKGNSTVTNSNVSKRRRTVRKDQAQDADEETATLCLSDPECLRLRVEVQKGDLFIINTRIWWHQTRIPSTGGGHRGGRGLSVSYARDFFAPLLRLPARETSGKFLKSSAHEKEVQDDQEEYTNVDGVYAARAVRAGEVVLTEDELPDCALSRSATDPSCEVVWLEDGSGALVALRDLEVGAWLSIAPSDSEDEEGEEEVEDSDDNDSDDEDE